MATILTQQQRHNHNRTTPTVRARLVGVAACKNLESTMGAEGSVSHATDTNHSATGDADWADAIDTADNDQGEDLNLAGVHLGDNAEVVLWHDILEEVHLAHDQAGDLDEVAGCNDPKEEDRIQVVPKVHGHIGLEEAIEDVEADIRLGLADCIASFALLSLLFILS